MKHTALIIAAFCIIGSVTGACPQAFAYADPPSDDPAPVITPVNVAPAYVAPVNVAPVGDTDVVIEQTAPPAITFSQRLAWFDLHTFGFPNLLGTIPGAAFKTGIDHPHEAGPHWPGFGARYGESLSTNAVSNTIEVSLGAIWGEDPRYFRAGPTVAAKSRIGHIVKSTFLAPNRDGEMRPAYARYVAFSGSSFISDAWRYPSDTSAGNEFGRIGLSFVGRMASNAFDEFWPDTKRKLFHHAPKQD